MDRRTFVLNATRVAAASALGYSSAGCAANEIYSVFPCLSVVPPPTPVAGMTYIKASQIGCALDCDLTTGLNKNNGGPATDDAPVINAAMAGASATDPITLILDGGALISGLFMPAGGYWSIAGLGCGTGFFIKTGTNNDGIHNGGPTAAVPSDPGPTVPLPARGSSVSLSNFSLNGNRGDGLNGDSTSGNPAGSTTIPDLGYFAINLTNLNNITLENVVVVDSPSYHFRLSNVGNVVASGCVMQSSGPNTDGIHFDGPANNIAISNCSFTTGDDAIALNCPEGYSGNISQVSVTGCTFNSPTLMRLYTGFYPGPELQISGVTVSDCTATLIIAGFLIGIYANNIPNAVLELSVSNCQITAPCVLDISMDFSSIQLSGVTFIPWGNTQGGYALARTFFASSRTPYTGASLSLTNCVVQRNGNFPVDALMLLFGSTIENFAFNGYSMQDAAGSSYTATPQLLNILSGSVPQLVLAGVTSTQIAAPVSPGGFASIGSVSGAGVLATDWQFPDAVMANNTPYISASTGLGSIKINGVVTPYP